MWLSTPIFAARQESGSETYETLLAGLPKCAASCFNQTLSSETSPLTCYYEPYCECTVDLAQLPGKCSISDDCNTNDSMLAVQVSISHCKFATMQVDRDTTVTHVVPEVLPIGVPITELIFTGSGITTTTFATGPFITGSPIIGSVTPTVSTTALITTSLLSGISTFVSTSHASLATGIISMGNNGTNGTNSFSSYTPDSHQPSGSGSVFHLYGKYIYGGIGAAILIAAIISYCCCCGSCSSSSSGDYQAPEQRAHVESPAAAVAQDHAEQTSPNVAHDDGWGGPVEAGRTSYSGGMTELPGQTRMTEMGNRNHDSYNPYQPEMGAQSRSVNTWDMPTYN